MNNKLNMNYVFYFVILAIVIISIFCCIFYEISRRRFRKKNIHVLNPILDFITEYVSNIGPFVFSGYGTRYQNELNDCMNTGDFTKVLMLQDKHLSNFIKNNNQIELLEIMLDIFLNKPIEYSNNIASRAADDWDFCIHKIISEIGNLNPEITIERLNNILCHNVQKRKEIIEILSFMDCQKSIEILLKIES